MPKKGNQRKTKQAYERHIALFASQEEVRKFELIKTFHCRKSDSDMVRFLINQEAEKIFPKNTPISVTMA